MMTSVPRPTGSPRRNLAIRLCRTFSDDGSSELQTSVHCPRQERSVGVDDCSTCSLSGGLHLDPAERRTSVVCKWPTVEPGSVPLHSTRSMGVSSVDPLTPLVALMAHDVLCVRPEVSVEALRSIFLDNGISGVPVVDEEGKPIGVVSKTDVVREDRDGDALQEVEPRGPVTCEGRAFALEHGFHVVEAKPTQVSSIMAAVAYAIHESANVGQAAALMAYEGVHRLPWWMTTGRSWGSCPRWMCCAGSGRRVGI